MIARVEKLHRLSSPVISQMLHIRHLHTSKKVEDFATVGTATRALQTPNGLHRHNHHRFERRKD
jgi:hypothetical protein